MELKHNKAETEHANCRKRMGDDVGWRHHAVTWSKGSWPGTNSTRHDEAEPGRGVSMNIGRKWLSPSSWKCVKGWQVQWEGRGNAVFLFYIFQVLSFTPRVVVVVVVVVIFSPL